MFVKWMRLNQQSFGEHFPVLWNNCGEFRYLSRTWYNSSPCMNGQKGGPGRSSQGQANCNQAVHRGSSEISNRKRSENALQIT